MTWRQNTDQSIVTMNGLHFIEWTLVGRENPVEIIRTLYVNTLTQDYKRISRCELKLEWKSCRRPGSRTGNPLHTFVGGGKGVRRDNVWTEWTQTLCKVRPHPPDTSPSPSNGRVVRSHKHWWWTTIHGSDRTLSLDTSKTRKT